MNQDREKFQFPLKLILFQWKIPIMGFLTLVGVASYTMTKLHPQKTIFGKEYNYMYSLENTMRNGSKVSIPKVESKLCSFENLRPLFDDLFIEAYLDEANIDKVDKLLDGIHERLPVQNEIVNNFTLGSLGMEEKDFKGCYEKGLALLENERLHVDYPTLYTYNLYRIHLLEEALGYNEKAAATKEKLLSYLQLKKDTESGNRRTLRTIHAKLTK